MSSTPMTRTALVFAVLALSLVTAVAFDLGYRGSTRLPVQPAWPMGDADRERGRRLITDYGCGACHTIPGIRHATGRVGPKLEDFVDQMYIAGVLANTPENLNRWLQHPTEVNPLTAMPEMGVSEEEARDMAAYLYTMR